MPAILKIWDADESPSRGVTQLGKSIAHTKVNTARHSVSAPGTSPRTRPDDIALNSGHIRTPPPKSAFIFCDVHGKWRGRLSRSGRNPACTKADAARCRPNTILRHFGRRAYLLRRLSIPVARLWRCGICSHRSGLDREHNPHQFHNGGSGIVRSQQPVLQSPDATRAVPSIDGKIGHRRMLFHPSMTDSSRLRPVIERPSIFDAVSQYALIQVPTNLTLLAGDGSVPGNGGTSPKQLHGHGPDSTAIWSFGQGN